jgi:hypothetical protein
MARDDSFLYTGVTSLSQEPRTPRQLQKESKVIAKQKLKPAADVVLEAISKERDAITDIRTMILDRTSTEVEVNTELLARKLYLGYLNTLEHKIKSIVSDK